MSCKIISVRAKDKSKRLIRLEAEDAGERRIYTVSEGTYREIGCPLSGEIIDGDALERVSLEDEEHRAMSKALRLLAYADNNEQNLFRKLRMAGFGKHICEATVAECIRLGYIDEERQLQRLITQYVNRDLLGPGRLMQKLLSKGYSSRKINSVLSVLTDTAEIDFLRSRDMLIEKKQPQTEDERQKLLYKFGYKND